MRFILATLAVLILAGVTLAGGQRAFTPGCGVQAAPGYAPSCGVQQQAPVYVPQQTIILRQERVYVPPPVVLQQEQVYLPPAVVRAPAPVYLPAARSFQRVDVRRVERQRIAVVRERQVIRQRAVIGGY